jgi:hypothetical protein
LELENFSGKTEHTVLQDFYATIFIANVALACAALADEEIAKADKAAPLTMSQNASSNASVVVPGNRRRNITHDEFLV